MQSLNKSAVKGTLYHTWFIYPVAAALLSIIWLWSFPAFHQPTPQQKIDIFFSSNVHSDAFTKPILEKYDRENLREITVNYASPENVLYYQKLEVAMNNSDIMVLTKTTFEAYSKHYVNYFVPIGSYVQEKIGIDESRIKDGYGVLLKNKDENHYLENYISFANEDYYLVFMISSQNLGSALDENNGAHDNALTFTRYLLEGDE